MADQEPEIITGRPEELAEQRNQAVSQPAQLLRIGAMLRELLEEVRRASPDDAGRKRLREIYDRALSVLKAGLSEAELGMMVRDNPARLLDLRD